MNSPKHVAIIMDGNGRWGIKKKNSRNFGHTAGVKTVEKIIRFTPENNDISKNVSVLIFAGGKGVRMGKKYSDIPKSIIEVDGKALIQRVIENLTSQGFSDISIALNHKSKKIVNYLNKNLPDHNFNYIFEKRRPRMKGRCDNFYSYFL